ncbi:adenylate/guanylate cyclase domain-containing protein [Oceaniserpentilla sp. 4NH20-0058]|uniref:CHASE2 domain-containing protein n=1 Tax=Oceaniserpentilla sp. 4NH20-0058 TaxID=3127660 RepID=UPI00310306A5
MVISKAISSYGTRFLAAVISAVIIWAALSQGSSASVFTRIEYLLYDIRFNLFLPITKRESSDHKIAIIDIDEQSIVNEGRFPWSRQKVAHLIERLGEAGAIIIAFDVVFSEKETNPVERINQTVPADWLQSIDTAKWQEISQLADADAVMAKAMGQNDVVLGFFFQDEEAYQNGQLPPSVFSVPQEWQNKLVVTQRPGYTANIPSLQSHAGGGGFVTMFPDFDGTVRRAPLLIRHGDQLYPSLALSAAMRYLFIDSIEPSVVEVGDVLALTHVAVSEKPAPTSPAGFVSVPYQGPAFSYPYYSATDVLRGNLEPGVLDGAVVFVGASAIGLADLRSTPMGPQYPGVEVHANILDALLSGGFPQKPEWQAGAVFLQLILIAVLMIVLLPKLGPTFMLVGGSTIIVCVILFNGYLWSLGLDLPMAGAVMLTLFLTATFITDGFLKESASKRMLKGMFDQYVPPAHIDKMLSDPDSYSFSGESKELTVLFSDIRSFTNISETLNAQELKHMLNSYFTPITKEIFDRNGTIDKYVGDMVMAFWGAPIDDDKHRENAVLAALNMQRITEDLKAEFKEQGLPEVNIGVGVNTGLMNVGDMGSNYRRSYTVLGDAVNLGSRLESITKFYGAKILIGEDTYDNITGFVCRFVDRIQVKGKEEAIRVYEPLGVEGEVEQSTLDEIQQYDQAYSLYLKQDWVKASAAFSHLYEQNPLKLYQVYIERIADLTEQTLADDWDGTFRHTSK